ncbi:uncharacterized protein J8A68_000820 [[Candida] subhashii]|uniref:Uncharacterized protein n=1 Tax=[Candida] subhashii TaxID=561895 RepID=A0A8J5V524_9ASCO|nr:uncharacterized protein J8A68_000820 [[Candida] subhashii]KAG7665614.1 hypothetical protein J8A68_000820 [[Candida] subhashii]
MEYSEIIATKFLQLPNEVLELVLGYIPTTCLLQYTDIQTISEIAGDILNDRNIKVWIGNSNVGLFQSFDGIKEWAEEPNGDEMMLEPDTLNGLETVNPIKFAEIDWETQFGNFYKAFPILKIDLTIFGCDLLRMVYSKFPACFENVRKLTLLKTKDEEQTEDSGALSGFPYPIHGMGTLNKIQNCKLPESIRMLEVGNFYELFSPKDVGLAESQITELHICSAIDIKDVKYLPRGLKKLQISLKTYRSGSKPSFPPWLESLEIASDRWRSVINKLNISELKNLKSLKLMNWHSPNLNTLKAPKQIKNLELISRDLVSLDGIQVYKELNDFKLYVFHKDAYSILNDPLPNSIRRLTFDWKPDYSNQIGTGPSRLEEGKGMQPIRLPPKLRVLNVTTGSPLFCPQSWNFPTSLRVLSLNVAILPPQLQLPPNLIALDLHGYSTSNLPDPLPKSLVRIRTSLLPSTKDSLVDLHNLSHIDFDFKRQPVTSFDWNLPSSLRRLILQYDQLKALKLESSKLRVVKVTLDSFSMFDELQLPDSVIKLSMRWNANQRYASKFVITDRHKLPKNLQSFQFVQTKIDTKSLINLRLNDLQNLRYINLNDNKITEIECGAFPSTTKTLILSNNDLQKVGTNVFKELPQLECLNLEYNKLGENVSNPIEFPESLRFLSLTNNSLKDVDDLIFGQEPRLKRIQLRNNEFPDTEEVSNKLRQKLGKAAAIIMKWNQHK